MNETKYQKNFREARQIIRKYYGLELTLIELVHLKNCVIEAMNEGFALDQNKESEWNFNVDMEATLRFFHRHYGVHPSVFYEPIINADNRPAKEYFRRVQERLHLP